MISTQHILHKILKKTKYATNSAGTSNLLSGSIWGVPKTS